MAEPTKPVDRTNRDVQTRDTSTREDELRAGTRKIVQWRPASSLPEIPETPGWRFKWVRKSVYGQSDPTNMGKKRRENWEPVSLSEYPHLSEYVDSDTKGSGNIEIGGLVLHKIPEEFARAREQYFKARGSQAVAAAEAQYREQAKPVKDMPIFNENRSEVKFGSGNN